MHPGHRAAFNAAFSDDLYRRYAADLAGRLGTEAGFRLAETPVFLTADLAASLEKTAREIVALLDDDALTARLTAAIPERWRAPGMDARPHLLQVDLAVTEADGRLAPKLIELQGFPSLSAFEVLQADAWSDALQGIPGLPSGRWSPYFGGRDRTSFVALLRDVVVGAEDPEHVVLLDLEPQRQKTWVDFAATRKLLGVDAVDPGALVKEGRRLFREKDGRRVPVRRIYNRVVFDELIQAGTALPFDFRDDLDVTWVPHPNWYWTWSKYAIPFLSHPAVPKATFLSELDAVPDDLGRYVLKPLFSFAGGGVNVEPTRTDVDRVPASERSTWCLQEKIDYAPALRAVDGGGVKTEVRMMFYRPDGSARLEPGLNLCRLSRGKMLGVDFNKDFTWVGSSVAIRPEVAP